MNSAEVLRICSNRDCRRVEWMHNAAEPVKYTQTMLKLISSLVDQQRTEHGPGGMWARPDDRSCSVVGGPAAELLTYDLNMLDCFPVGSNRVRSFIQEAVCDVPDVLQTPESFNC